MFQPTLPMRGATTFSNFGFCLSKCFNPRSPCGERLTNAIGEMYSVMFQPTLPMRGATELYDAVVPDIRVSTHAPHAGSDRPEVIQEILVERFQPTLPMRGATLSKGVTLYASRCFNPRSPCGERPCPQSYLLPVCCFNPRSPCGERLANGSPMTALRSLFQPTLPMRGATSLNALDVFEFKSFNPRSPCGERL